ncbi:MAG: outer membrane protein assembly factor BamD [Verrucomicrobiota bacterium]
MALVLVLSLSACSQKLSKQTGLTDAGLFALGQKKAEQKKYGAAAEAFQMLIERFPMSPLAPQAQFALAVNRIANKDDVEAEVALDDFLRLYPADPKVPDALLMKGRLLYRQVLAPERDQTKTGEAIKAYQQFLAKAPASPYAPEAAARIRELRNRLALHEVAVVSHYLNRKLYASADVRARLAVETYPDVDATPTLLSLRAQALDKEGKKEEATQVRATLAAKYPDAEKKKPSFFSGIVPAGIRMSPYRGRKRRYEITLQPRYVASKNIDAGGGSTIELDSGLGLGLGVGYNFTDRFALHLDGSWVRSDYQAKIATSSAGSIGRTSASGTLDVATVALNLSYYFLDGPLTPFVLGGIGWTFVDSNIPSGPPQGVCWWDPWYGYICTSYQNTYTKNYFSYNLGLGARWDVTSGFFVRGSVGWQWVDLGTPGTTDFLGGRLDLGYMF